MRFDPTNGLSGLSGTLSTFETLGADGLLTMIEAAFESEGTT